MAGVDESDHFILFLNNKTLSRSFVQDEVKKAMSTNKKIVIVYESSEERGALVLPNQSVDLKTILVDQVSANPTSFFFFTNVPNKSQHAGTD